MSTSLDIELRGVVQELMTEFGKTGQIESAPSQEYDPLSGTVTESTPLRYTVKYVPPFPASKVWSASTVKEGDFETWIEPSTAFKIDNGLKVKIDTEWWKVVEYRPVYTGDDIALYGMLLRR